MLIQSLEKGFFWTIFNTQHLHKLQISYFYDLENSIIPSLALETTNKTKMAY